MAASATSAKSNIRIHDLPGATAFPESIGADARNGEFFTGSFLDGTVYRGTLNSPEAEVLLPAGSDGRTSVTGVKVDNEGRVWIADADHGRVLVYDEAGKLLHTFVLAGPGSPLLNDLVVSRGSVFVTDSSRPFLYRLAENAAHNAGTTIADPWLNLGSPVTYTSGINLNGIVASPNGRILLTIQTNTGNLYRIDVVHRSIATVAIHGVDLSFGDGLLRVGDDLYVARNAANEIVKLRLGRGWNSATSEATITNAAFAYPAGLADMRGRLLVTNAQFNAAPDPLLPFTVLDLPLR
jgi:Cu-Zn family superoxide dismutase